MRRKQVMREIGFDAGGSGTDPLDFASDLRGLGGAAHGSESGAQASGGGAHGSASGAQRSEEARGTRREARSAKSAGVGATGDAQDSDGAHDPPRCT